MKIGDVAAPHALLRSSLEERGSVGFLQTLGTVQRARRARQVPQPLHEVSSRQERAREFEERRDRLEQAARKLSENPPQAASREAADRVEDTARREPTPEAGEIQRIEAEAFTTEVADFARAYNELRSFVDEEGLDLGDQAGLLGSDVRIRSVAGVISELASSLAERRSQDGLALADVGIDVSDDGELSVDAERLQEALAQNGDSVVELLSAEGAGLGQSALKSVTASPEAERSLSGGMVGFLSGLSNRQQQLSEQAGVLETVVSSLSGATTNRDVLD